MESETVVSKRTLIVIYSITAITILLVIIISVTTVSNKGCSININEDFSKYHPLLLKLNSPEFILPNNGPEITFSNGESIRLACPGQNNYLTLNKDDLVTITCFYDKTFWVDGNDNLFNEFKCANYSESIVRTTQNKCAEKYTQTEIGFNTSAGFVNLITTCFDDVKKDSLYSEHILSSQINYTQKTDNPKFEQGSYYGNLILDNLYTSTSQQKEFKKILGISVETFINKQKCFNRGHLAPKGDFIYATQKRATYYYMNVAPQWMDFNGGNWNQLEISARNFAINQTVNLIVYTGIYGNAKLLNKINTLQDISLNSDNKLTVPKIYWKILYEPVNKAATVFIGHNNPYEHTETFEKLCPDVCDKITWLLWNPEDKNKGISYCCEYAQVKKFISYLPDITVEKLLI